MSHVPTPISPHTDLPSLFLAILYTLLLISCVVSSFSSPSPSKSCTDAEGANGWPGSAAVSCSVSAPGFDSSDSAAGDPTLLSAGFAGSLDENTEMGAAASGAVLDALPKPNPTGLPILPAGLPNENGEGFEGEVAPNENALGFSVLTARLKGFPLPNEAPVEAEEPASSLSSVLNVVFPKRLVDAEGVMLDDPNRNGELDFVDVAEAAAG